MLRSFERRFDLKCVKNVFPRLTMKRKNTVRSGTQQVNPILEKSKHYSLAAGRRAKTFFTVYGQLVLGLASGLEAFSREPPCDSIGALAARQTPETSGMAWEFLSYYPKLPSRCLRDPLRYLVIFLKKRDTKNRLESQSS